MLLAAVLAAKAVSANDQETGGRVVAIEPDPHLEQATRVALTSWHVDLVSTQGPAPGRDLDDAIRTAHRIARASQARAVVWISPDPASKGYSLWVYDDRAHAIAVRPLPSAPPYDDATSAAIALTVKTLLFSAFEKPAREPGLPEPEPKPTPPPPAPRAVHTVRIDTLGGFRVPTHASDVLAARFGAEVAYFPSFLHQMLGVAIAADAGPSVLVEHAPLFSGTFTDTVASLSLRLRIPLRSWLALELGAGGGLHFSALEGSSAALDLAGRVSRIDGSIEAMVAPEFSWKVLRVSPTLATSVLPHYQHYLVNDVQVYAVPTGQVMAALRIGVELP